jgi:adenylate cyclase
VEMPELERRHTTIMSADVVGYSRMMAENDFETVRALLDVRVRIARFVDGFGGRVVDAVGDNMLAEFSHPAAALQCATLVQAKLHERNRSCSPSSRVQLRIGLHSGSVLSTRNSVFGDVVNVAARLQSQAHAGQVLMSYTVADVLPTKLHDLLIDRGVQHLKNIPYAVQTFETSAVME